MRQYTLAKRISLDGEQGVQVVNETGEQIGIVSKTHMDDCERGHCFSYTTLRGDVIRMGIKKRGLTSLLRATYQLEIAGKIFEWKDDIGKNLLYFSVSGKLGEKAVTFQENWKEEIDATIESKKIALIQPKMMLKTTLSFDASIDEREPIFALTVLMLFMYRIYQDEAEVVENVLDHLFE